MILEVREENMLRASLTGAEEFSREHLIEVLGRSIFDSIRKLRASAGTERPRVLIVIYELRPQGTEPINLEDSL